MTKEELYNKLDSVKKKLEKAHDKGDKDKIERHVKRLNELWKQASVEMLKNAAKDGFVPTEKN
tara:strand:+ start:507 stop:695 length:189 start_codon:yes stop_codon:yes gene_type:complete